MTAAAAAAADVVVIVVAAMMVECGDGYVAVWRAQTCHWVQEGARCLLKTAILNAAVAPLVLHLEQIHGEFGDYDA